MKREEIKFTILTFCLLILGFLIGGNLIEINNKMDEMYNQNNAITFDIFQTQNKEINISYSDFYFILSKLLELLFLVPGFFMNLIFINNLNKDFSWIELIKNI